MRVAAALSRYVEEVRRLLPRAVVDLESDSRVEHAFVLSRFACGLVAGKVVESLRETLGEPSLLQAALAYEDDAEEAEAEQTGERRAYSADQWVARAKRPGKPKSRL